MSFKFDIFNTVSYICFCILCEFLIYCLLVSYMFYYHFNYRLLSLIKYLAVLFVAFGNHGIHSFFTKATFKVNVAF